MAGHDAGFAAKKARRTKLNHEAVIAFAGAMAGIAAVFIVFHLIRRIAQHMQAGQKRSSKPSFFAVLSRKTRKLLLRKVPTLPSGGHAVTVALYLAINVIITFTNVDTKIMKWNPNLASRTGWMAVVNLVVLVFLALKNTPLAFLISWSYERLNVLHRVAGYMTITFVIIHACCYSSYFGLDGRITFLLKIEEIYGMIAGLSFVVIGFSGAVIRRWWYELFYVIHVSFWCLSIVMLGLHQPLLGKRILFVTVACGGMWVLDRMIRLVRLVFYSINNSATLTPLPNGGTRVSLKKAPAGATSGKHCFLWIPQIRSCETHPFTIAAMDPLEFVVTSHDGFTRDLHQYALKHPGESVKASVEGSYGTYPDPARYDKVVLVAGGSGATFTFGAALNMLKSLSNVDPRNIVFIWVVQYESQLTWFARHLNTLKNDDRVSLQLYVTKSAAQGTVDSGPEIQSERTTAANFTISSDEEKAITMNVELPSPTSISSEKASPYETDSATTHGGWAHGYGNRIKHLRPDVGALLRRAIGETPSDQKVLVLGCGPDGLMTEVRNTTVDCIRTDGPGVELHCEQFGW